MQVESRARRRAHDSTRGVLPREASTPDPHFNPTVRYNRWRQEQKILRSKTFVTSAAVSLVLAVSCGPARESAPTAAKDQTTGAASKVKKQAFGKLADGQEISLYTLSNKNGMEASVMNYGAILVSLRVPDKAGKMGDVVLGFDSLEGYLKPNPYFGAIVGRYGNRIAHGTFQLDGARYTLAKNNGANSLHGGLKGFDKQVWTAQETTVDGAPAVAFHYLSKDGEEGYPGNLSVTVTYSLNDANELKIGYSATTDKGTVLNVTNHSYFNLKGEGEGDILGHVLRLNADRFTPVDSGLIPTGELKPVKGTPFDFTTPEVIGARIEAKDEQIKLGGGYDHNFVLNKTGKEMSLAAVASDLTQRPRYGSVHDGARRPVLHRQLSGRQRHRQEWPRVCEAQRLLPRNAALSGFTQPPQVPQRSFEARRNICVHDGLQVLGEVDCANHIARPNWAGRSI